jgi:hypothetical protein
MRLSVLLHLLRSIIKRTLFFMGGRVLVFLGFVDIHDGDGTWSLHDMQLFIIILKFKNVVVECVCFDVCLVLFAHNVGQVVCVLLLADSTVGVLLVGSGKHNFWLSLLHLTNMLVVVRQFLLIVDLDRTPVHFQNEGRSVVLAIEVEYWEGLLG